MSRIIILKSLGYYEQYIQSRFVRDHCGINLAQSGLERTTKISIPVDLKVELATYYYLIKDKTQWICKLIENEDTVYNPLWFKINVTDQAINDYVGIGFLNTESDWLKFILLYLDVDRAEQAGDTILALFDIDFTWGVSFTLSQDNSVINIEKYSNPLQDR